MPQDDDYAIVIGINDYNELDKLKGPINDADGFYNWLIGIGNVPPKNISLIKSNVNNYPMVHHINSEIKNLIISNKNLNNNRAFTGRRLYIFCSGHGIYISSFEDTALLTVEASSNSRGYHIPGKSYSDWFKDAAMFKEIILIMDCCRDNYSKNRLNYPPWDPIINEAENGLVEFASIFSTKSSKKSKDTSNIGDMSPFTKVLLNGLNGDAKDINGNVTVESLGKYLHNQDFPALNSFEKQEPHIEPNNKPEQLIFCTIQNTTNNNIDVELNFSRPTINIIRISEKDITKTPRGIIPLGQMNYKITLNKNETYFLLTKQESLDIFIEIKTSDQNSMKIDINI